MNIQDEFVTKDIALALKEIGYKEECLAFINGNDLELIEFSYSALNGWKGKDIGQCLHIPTYQAILKWFRDKHNKITTSVFYLEYYGEPKVEGWSHTYQLDDNSAFSLIEGEKLFSTYEEAQTALIWKLIEEVKRH